jgi:hypothetical protein
MLLAIGAFGAIYGYLTLDIGTPQRMGPGLMPVALSVLLIVFGIIVTITALRTSTLIPPISWRPMLTVTASVLGFALSAKSLGLVPAILIVLIVSSTADGRITRRQLGAMAICLPLAAWLIFDVGLGISLPLFHWPL